MARPKKAPFLIKDTPTPEGVRSSLYFYFKGKQYRPTLGYNLSPDQQLQVGAGRARDARH